MNVIVNRKALVSILNSFTEIVQRNPVNPIWSTILLKHGAGGYGLEISGSDLGEVYAVATVNATPGEGGPPRVVVNLRQLRDVVKAWRGDLVTIDGGHLDGVKVTDGSSVATLPGVDPLDFPTPSCDGGPRGFYSLPFGALRTALATVVYAETDQDPRFTLNNISLKLTQDECEVAATDGHRLAVACVSSYADCDPPWTTECISSPCARLVASIEGQIEVRVARYDNPDGGVFARFDSMNYDTRASWIVIARIDGKRFPVQYRSCVPQRDKGLFVPVERKALLNAAKAIKRSVNKKTRAAKFTLCSSGLILETYNADVASRESVACYYDGAQLEVLLSAHFVVDALTAMSECTVEFQFPVKGGPAVLRPCSYPDLPLRESEHVIMPVRS